MSGINDPQSAAAVESQGGRPFQFRRVRILEFLQRGNPLPFLVVAHYRVVALLRNAQKASLPHGKPDGTLEGIPPASRPTEFAIGY